MVGALAHRRAIVLRMRYFFVSSRLPRCLIAWTEALREASGGAIVASDGKTRRHAFERAPGPAAIPMVRAWASAKRLGLGQRPVAEQANDITALPTR